MKILKPKFQILKTKLYRRPKRSLLFGAVIFIAIAVILFWQIQPAVKAAVTIDTAGSTATQYSEQRKTWYDGSRYWVAFYAGGTNIEFWYCVSSDPCSTDASKWHQNTSATLNNVHDADFSIVANSTNAFIAYQGQDFGETDAHQATSYPGTSFSWGTAVTPFGAGDTVQRTHTTISKDSSSYIWVMGTAVAGGILSAVKSSSPDSIATWGSPQTVSSSSSSNNSIASIGSGNMLGAWKETSNQFYSKKYNGSAWDTNPTPIDTASSGDTKNISLVSKPSAAEAYASYIDSGGKTKFRKYIDSNNTGWTTSYDTTQTTIYSLAVDSTNGVLYAGTNDTGIIYRCALSTACDAAGDWTTSYDTTQTTIYSLAVDSTNGVLYAGTNDTGIIYRCALSTACDAAGDWTTSYDTSELIIASLTVDSVNGVLYAGTALNGIIYRCALSTACDASGDWTTSNDTAESTIYSLAVDSTNGVLYAGTSSNGIIYRYSAGWNPPVTLDSNSGNSNTAISINTVNNDLYIMWIRSNTIYYKKCVSPYASANCDTNPTTFINSGTNNWLGSAFQAASTLKVPIIWVDGSSPYNIKFDYILTNASPGAPSLITTFANGTSVASTTPIFTMNSTDAEGDQVKYKFLLYNSTATSGGNCSGSSNQSSDQNAGDSAGWSNGTGPATQGTNITHTLQSALTRGNGYCAQAQAIDPSGSNEFGALSTPLTFTVNSIPSAPTLTEPSNGQQGLIAQPYLRLSTTDTDSDYLKYYIKFCGTDSSCATSTHLICQYASGIGIPAACSASQTGWSSQNQQSNTAYSSGQTAVYKYQYADLVAGTTYYWRAYGVDPGGSDTWSSASSIFSFRVSSSNPSTQHDVCIGAC